jgi:hypothetical protein
MIEEIAKGIPEFPGSANQTRCFLHIVNLVAKSVLRQFELPKTKGNDALTEAAQELAALSSDLEHDEEEDLAVDGDSEDEDDDEDGLQDGREGMSDAEIARLEKSVQPVRLVFSALRSGPLNRKITAN